MLPIKAVSFGTPKAVLSRAVRRSSQTDAKRRFRRAGRLAAAALGAMVLALVGASAAAAASLIAYVSNAKTDLVLPIHLATGTLLAAISTNGVLTSSIAISSSTLAYAPSIEGETLFPINLSTPKIEAGIVLNAGKGKIEPEAVAITPDGTLAWVVDEEFKGTKGAVSVVKVPSNQISSTIEVGEEPEAIAFTGELAWVVDKATEKLGTVTVINIPTGTIAKTINIGTPGGNGQEKCKTEGANPAKACVEPDSIVISGKFALVGEGAAGTVAVIEITGNSVGKEVSVGLALVSNQEPASIAITPNGSLAYVTNNLLGTVVPIEIKKEHELTVDKATTVGAGPTALATTADSSLVVVADEEAENVEAIETSGSKINQVAKTFLVLGEPDGIAITP